MALTTSRASQPAGSFILLPLIFLVACFTAPASNFKFSSAMERKKTSLAWGQHFTYRQLLTSCLCFYLITVLLNWGNLFRWNFCISQQSLRMRFLMFFSHPVILFHFHYTTIALNFWIFILMTETIGSATVTMQYDYEEGIISADDGNNCTVLIMI